MAALRLSRSELALYAGVMLIVAALVVPGWLQWNRLNRLEMARLDIGDLISACRRFHAEYKRWPTGRTTDYGDTRFGLDIPNQQVMNVLRDVDGVGNPEHSVNTNRVVYFKAQPAGPGQSGLDKSGEFVDPWGKPYQIVLDTDQSGLCNIENSIYGDLIAGGVLSWSGGPDRKLETPDDILSWKLSTLRFHIQDEPRFKPATNAAVRY